MSEAHAVVAESAEQLATLLGLSRADAAGMQLRRRLNDKIVQAVKKSGLTHAAAAKLAGTSRTRLTAILNRNTSKVSTDLMLRILLALGYRAEITFVRSRRVA